MMSIEVDGSNPASSEPVTPEADTSTLARGWRWAALALCLTAGAGAILAAASYHRPPPPEVPAPPGLTVLSDAVKLTPQAPQWKLIEVKPARIAEDRWTDPVPAYVRVDESRAASVGVPLAGRVTRVMAELGQEVKAGDPLFVVSSPELTQLEQDISRSQVELETARAAYDRVSAMVAARALPAKEELIAKQTLRQAELTHGTAGSRLASLKVGARSANEFVVKSPRDGRVVEKHVLPAQEITSGSPALMMIADLSSVWVVAEVFESESAGIQIGSAARVTAACLPGTTVSGTIDMVSAVVDPERHSVPIRMRLDNPALTLKPNTYATMELLSKAPAGAVEVPSSAVVSDGARQLVYVKEADGTLKRRRVVAGSAHSDVVVITAGLKAGEQVVVRGAVLLDNQIEMSF